MYWFRRPPYVRWGLAVVVVAGALWMDLRGTPSEPRPFARSAIEAGTRIDEAMIEYRNSPLGLLDDFTPDGFAITDIEAGEPLTKSLLTDKNPLPEGWWALEMVVPDGVVPGTELRIIVDEAGSAIPAVVVAISPPDKSTGWSNDPAMVAIPAETAPMVAVAIAEAGASVLVVEW